MYVTLSQFLVKHKLTSIANPPGTTTFQNSVVQFPIYHFFDKRESLGPTINEMFVNAILTEDDNEVIYVDHVVNLTEPTDNQKPRLGEDKKVPLTYHKAHRRFNRSFDIDKTLKKKNPLIINYNPLMATYRTVQDRMDLHYDDSVAYIKTVNAGVKRIKSNRPQFLLVNLPQVIPPIDEIRKHLTKQTHALRRDVKSFNGVFFIEILKTLLGEGGSVDSLLNTNVILTFVDTGSVVYVPMDKYRELAEKATDNVKLKFWLDIADSLVELRTTEAEANEVSEEFANEVAEPEENATDTEVRDERTINSAKRLLASGTITEGEFNRHMDLAKEYKNLPVDIPTGGNTPAKPKTVAEVLNERKAMGDAIRTKPLPKLKGVSASLPSTTIRDWDEQYITTQLEPDLIETFMAFQNGPIAVTGIERVESQDAGNSTVLYKIETKGLKGAKGTIPLEFPKVRPDGTFIAGGVDYRMATQRVNYPLVKTGPNEVVLTSAMSKLFLTSGGKKKNDYYHWIEKNILLRKEEGLVTNLRFGNTVSNEPTINYPPMLSAIGNKYKQFTVANVEFNFTEEVVNQKHKGLHQVGTIKGKPVVMGEDNSLYAVDSNKLEPLPDLSELLNLDSKKAPRPFAELKVKGKQVPMGVLFCYWIGFKRFLNYVKIPFRIEPLEKQVGADNYVLRLADAKVVIEAKTALHHLLVAGWNEFKKELRLLKVSELEHSKNYSVLFTPKGITKSHELEFNMMVDYWIDPTTEKLLRERKYPTKFYPLYIKAVSMLEDRQHLNENDGRVFVERRYSRFNDMAYGMMMTALRDYHRNTQSNRRITAPPKGLLTKILMDETVSPTEQVNPLGLSNEQDRIVQSGDGGRSNQSLVGRHRVFDKHEKGRISEAYTDDGKAGTVKYYTADPQVESVYGLPSQDIPDDVANKVSFSMLYSPFVIYNDPKRGNYARIQNNAWRANNGRTIPPIITNAGITESHRVNGIYAFVSKEAGKVTEVTEEAIKVVYDDKSEATFALGLKTGKAAGKIYPRRLITDRKKGYKFTSGEVLAWDEYSFYRDRYNPTQVNLYNGSWSITCFRERAATYEDASRVSLKSTKKMACDVIHVHTLRMSYSENVKLMFKKGDTVEQTDILAYITPPGVALPEGESNNLDYYSVGTPRSDYSGEVIGVDVFYLGEQDDETTESITKLIKAGDKDRKKRAEVEDIHPTGEYKQSTYIGKQELSDKTVIVQIYIMAEELWGGGDKRAFGNALKTVPGKVYDTLYSLEDGTPIDADFSFNGLKARITPGDEILGVIALNVRQIGLNAAKLYRGK